MTLSHILASADATTVALDFGVFIATQAKTYRTSQTAIIAALVPHITPSQPAPSSSLALAADPSDGRTSGEATDGEAESSLLSTPSVAPIPDAPVVSDTGEQARDDEAVGHSAESVFCNSPPGADSAADRAPITAQPAKPKDPAKRSKPLSTRVTLADKIRNHLATDPKATATDIAKALGVRTDSVTWAAQKKNIKLRKMTSEDRSKLHAKVHAERRQAPAVVSTAQNESDSGEEAEVVPAPAPQPEPLPEPVPTKAITEMKAKRRRHRGALRTPEQIRSWAKRIEIHSLGFSFRDADKIIRSGRLHAVHATAAAHGSLSDVAKKVGFHPDYVKQIAAASKKQAPIAPRTIDVSIKFYLRDKAGRYVHQSLERSPTDTGPLMTINRAYAWFDNAQRFAGAAKVWPEINDMRKEGQQP